MRVVSVCSGGGGKDLGFARAGCRTVALCEADPWRRQLLARNFPGVRCWPDLTELDPAELPACDILIGGTPCQDLSHAGRRAGLGGERSGLFWHYARVRNALGVEWAVWENVEGALSTNDGVDFSCVLGAFVGADVFVPTDGWPRAGVAAGPWGGCVWRVLDAQHFGVPQRRRRIFVVGRLGGPCPPEVLLEPARGHGDSAQGGGARANAASASGGGPAPALVKRYAKGTDSDATDALVVNALDRRRGGADDNEAQAGQLVPALVSRSSRGKPTPLAPGHNTDEHIVAATLKASGVSGGRRTDVESTYVAHTLRSAGFDGSEDGTGRGTPLVPDGVRAADGLAGRVDGPVSAYDPQPDGRRYAACGDGVVAPVAEWIARRVMVAAT